MRFKYYHLNNKNIFDIETRNQYTEYDLEELAELLNKQDHKNKILAKALELAVADKCKFENEWLSMVVGMPNGKLLVPKKEQWYLEQAENELKDDLIKSLMNRLLKEKERNEKID